MVIMCYGKAANKYNSTPVKCSYVEWIFKLIEIKLTS